MHPRERFLQPGNPLDGRRSAWRGSFRATEESTETLQQAKQKWPAQSVLPRYAPQPEMLICIIWASGGQCQGEDWGWLHRDRLKALECGNWECTWNEPGPTREARIPCCGGGGGACRGKDARSGAGTTTGASFPAHALKQQVTAYRSSGVAGASCHYHPGLQRQVWATAAAERKGSRHSSLPLSGMGPGNTHELHTLKKEAASIQTKNPLNKNIKPTQTTQGCSCI